MFKVNNVKCITRDGLGEPVLIIPACPSGSGLEPFEDLPRGLIGLFFGLAFKPQRFGFQYNAGRD